MLRIVPHTVPRVGRSYEHFSDGFELHLRRQEAHVVVMMCVPPKPVCREASQKLAKIADYFSLLDPGERVVFGQLDLQKNQVPHGDVKEVRAVPVWALALQSYL